MRNYRIKYRMRQAGLLNVVTHSFDVEAMNKADAEDEFYKRFNPQLYDIVSISKTYFFGCLSGISLFWFLLFLALLLLKML